MLENMVLCDQIPHGNNEGTEGDIVTWCNGFLEAYGAAKYIFHPRPPDFAAGHFDHYQIASVARDNNGKCVWWSAQWLFDRPSSAAGEARAALEGIRMAIH